MTHGLGHAHSVSYVDRHRRQHIHLFIYDRPRPNCGRTVYDIVIKSYADTMPLRRAFLLRNANVRRHADFCVFSLSLQCICVMRGKFISFLHTPSHTHSVEQNGRLGFSSFFAMQCVAASEFPYCL